MEPPAVGSVMCSWRQRVEVEERGERVALESGGLDGRGVRVDRTEKGPNYYPDSAEEEHGKSEVGGGWQGMAERPLETVG